MDSVAYALEDQALMSRARNYFRWQARLIRPELGPRVLEVGCGTGNFTRALLDREAVIAIDIERACVERLCARYPDQPNLHTEVCGPEEPAFPALARFRPDSLICINVLEHIQDDLQAVQSMVAILPAEGVLILLVPAFPALYGPIDRNLGHHRRYTAASLSNLAQKADLQVRNLRYVNAVGFFGWWANARVFRRERQSAAQIAVFDRFFVPVLSRLEAIVPPPFGQSLLAVLIKK